MLDAAKDALGIESPSKKFRDEVGKFMAQGIGVGFSDEMDNVNRMIEKSIPREFDTGVKYSLQGTTQGRYLTGGVLPVRFSM